MADRGTFRRSGDSDVSFFNIAKAHTPVYVTPTNDGREPGYVLSSSAPAPPRRDAAAKSLRREK